MQMLNGARVTLLVFLATLVWLLPACSSFQQRMQTQTLPEEELFALGISKFEAGKWGDAIAVFDRFERLYINSERIETIRLHRADAYFNKDSASAYILAKAEYQSFTALYPRYENQDYIYKQVAICSFKQMLPANRDQSNTKDAISEFEEFLQKFPDSRYSPEIRQYVQEAYNQLAEHHCIVGDHYFKRSNFPAAAERYKEALRITSELSNSEPTLYRLTISLARASDEYSRYHAFMLQVNDKYEVERSRRQHELYLYEANQYLAEYGERYPQNRAKIEEIQRRINMITPIKDVEQAGSR